MSDKPLARCLKCGNVREYNLVQPWQADEVHRLTCRSCATVGKFLVHTQHRILNKFEAAMWRAGENNRIDDAWAKAFGKKEKKDGTE